MTHRNLCFLGLFFGMVVPLLAWCQTAADHNAVTLSPDLQLVRDSLQKYQDPVLAIHDGYLSTLGCADFPHKAKPGHEPYPQGAMGIHFFNLSLVGPKVDPMHPQILLYEPDGGKLRLVGVEYFMPFQAAGGKTPELFGQKFWGPMEGHEPLMPGEVAHYDLHVWLYKKNPEGLFAPTNPAVKCAGYPYAVEMESTKMLSPEAK